jgi:hypothetical protein
MVKIRLKSLAQLPDVALFLVGFSAPGGPQQYHSYAT